MAVKNIQVKRENGLLEDLFQAYYDARKNKRNSASALAFEIEYEKNLVQLWREITSRSYRPSPYSAFIVEKPVKREIFASNFRDRVVHHLIFNYLNPLFDPAFINDSYSCRSGKGTSYGIKRVNYFIHSCSDNYAKDAYILKLDIKGYFMSIDRTILFGIIKRRITQKQHTLSCELDLIVFLVKGVIFCDPTKGCVLKSTRESWLGLPKSKSLFYSGANKGLPIGNLTSQLFANIYLDGLDQFIKRQLKIRYYGRYVDDMVIVHGDKQRLLVAVKEISDYLSEHVSLTLHPKKIYLQHVEKGVSFLGVYIKPYRVMIGKRVKHSVLNEINHGAQTLKQLVEKNNTKSVNEFYFEFCQKLNSYFGLLRQADSYNFRRDLKKMVAYGFSGRLHVDKDLPESLRQIMMLIISNFVKNQVMAKPEKRLLIIDEGWMLLEHEESARFVAGLVRRARKYYLGVSIISQQANDFLKSDYGRAIASQSSLRILMRQDTTTIKGVVSEFNLSEYEQQFLLTCERGDALIIADQNHVAVKVVASDKEHPLITTNPAELYST